MLRTKHYKIDLDKKLIITSSDISLIYLELKHMWVDTPKTDSLTFPLTKGFNIQAPALSFVSYTFLSPWICTLARKENKTIYRLEVPGEIKFVDGDLDAALQMLNEALNRMYPPKVEARVETNDKDWYPYALDYDTKIFSVNPGWSVQDCYRTLRQTRPNDEQARKFDTPIIAEQNSLILSEVNFKIWRVNGNWIMRYRGTSVFKDLRVYEIEVSGENVFGSISKPEALLRLGEILTDKYGPK